MSRIIVLHASLWITTLALCAVSAVWGLIGYLRGSMPGSAYRALNWIATWLLIAEGALGLIVYLSGAAMPARSMHIVYGAIAIVAIPLCALGTRNRHDRAVFLVTAAVSLFVCILILRAVVTGRS